MSSPYRAVTNGFTRKRPLTNGLTRRKSLAGAVERSVVDDESPEADKADELIELSHHQSLSFGQVLLR